MKQLSILISLLLLVTLLTNVAFAQDPVGDDEVNAVAKKLYCPVCENTPLDVCPTQACKDWRELIRQQLSDGWTEAQVLDYFATNYGPQALAQPPASGFSALVWILPVIGLVGGGIFLWRLLRRWQNHPPPAEPVVAKTTTDSPDIAPEMLARIEQEIESRY
jgi:cytochrome c-type biogenesis protein CcmH